MWKYLLTKTGYAVSVGVAVIAGATIKHFSINAVDRAELAERKAERKAEREQAKALKKTA